MKTLTRPGPVVTIDGQDVELMPAHPVWPRIDLVVAGPDGELLVVHGRIGHPATKPLCPPIAYGRHVRAVAYVHVNARTAAVTDRDIEPACSAAQARS